ncbi:hypothetical protein PEL8287_02926 [Roseovarius litorisediminis]|uniref:DUF2147 domain-containing protein n=1 Tax=Roseovarius litorisediminis TaxID=1312363 RepID=A0A1Y5T628_9RHOB|nr:hypothetical protein PEL8287_02926 [Roseovarius litorisediminis]
MPSGLGVLLVGDVPVKKLYLTSLFLIFMTTQALARDPVLGVWQAPPDRKGQIGHIQISPCGSMLCGTIIQAYDPSGKEVVTPNVGKRLFWNMKVEGAGAYGGGRVFVPAHNREYDAAMKLQGQKLSVKGCVGPVCQGQVWTRVR